jgi:tRNA pseudouridine38-40 synthase
VFHARFSAKWRGYVYRIARRPVSIGRAYCWQCPFDLDRSRLQSAADRILGSCCFSSFSHSEENETHYLSDVYRAEWTEDGPYLDFNIDANRFLHGMVRFLVGTMAAIGRGKLEPQAMSEILESRDVRRAGQKAPASGLTLVQVGYRPWPEA